jgi:ABC-2 type transport system ATP-binding protein
MRKLSSHEPSIRVESVTRAYRPESWGRRHAFFARLGGIRPGLDQALLDDDDEMNDDDDGFDDLDDAIVEAGDGAKVALNDVSLTVSSGAVGIIGPPGAGKSVLLRVMAGIAPPTTGRVVVRGTAVPILRSMQSTYPRSLELRRSIVFMWRLLHLPVARPQKRVAEVFEFLGEPELGRRHVSTVRGWPIWRRILFASMLVLDPDIVLIDLELPETADAEPIRQRLLELKRRGALIVITGRDASSVAWVADRVVHMRRGRVVREESIDAALAASDEQYADAAAPEA